MTSGEHDAEDDDERAIQYRSFVALAWGAVLVVGAVWLVNHIMANNRLLACIESGRSNCVPITVNEPPRDTLPSPSINRLRDPWAKSKAPDAPPPR